MKLHQINIISSKKSEYKIAMELLAKDEEKLKDLKDYIWFLQLQLGIHDGRRIQEFSVLICSLSFSFYCSC
jgi:hypothetical protein